MLYVLFLCLAIFYNFFKFRKEQGAFLSSLIDAKNTNHREMILGHHFYIFIFEGFLSLIVAHLLTDKAVSIGILGLGIVYLWLVFCGFFLYRFFIRHIEKKTKLDLYDSFKSHLIKDLRVNFAIIMLPILIYSLINWTFQENIFQEWGHFWFIGLLFNIIFVSVLTIFCSVVIMLRLIPNREITEPEYLSIIDKRLFQIKQPSMRVRWIETDIKNAFVVGLKLLFISNQTLFIGKTLRTTLTLEEFDAVIAHELSHVANRHIHKRVIDLLKNFISVIFGIAFILLIVLGGSFLYWGDDAYIHSTSTTFLCIILSFGWFVFNYSILFDTIRSHEFEADGFAVMELGANFTALKSALEKLSNKEELPDYIKERTKRKNDKGFINKWITGKFTTHPDLSVRLDFLRYKMDKGLPFNHYISAPQKIRSWLGVLFQWRVFVPLVFCFIVSGFWAYREFKSGSDSISFINHATPTEIMNNEKLVQQINSRPQLLGQSLMYYIVRRKDERLIDYFISRGANKGKTLIYITQTKDSALLKKYYTQFKSELSQDDYFLALRKTAQLNFTEGYRFLVNADRFENLHPSYKEDVSRVYQSNHGRIPASVIEK